MKRVAHHPEMAEKANGRIPSILIVSRDRLKHNGEGCGHSDPVGSRRPFKCFYWSGCFDPLRLLVETASRKSVPSLHQCTSDSVFILPLMQMRENFNQKQHALKEELF
jgi:hypothetical protein